MTSIFGYSYEQNLNHTVDMNGNFRSSFMKKERKKKEKDMTAPRSEGGESLL